MPNILRTFSLQSNTAENHYLMPRISRPWKHPQYWKVTAWAQEHWSVCTSTWWLIKGGHFPESFAKVCGKQLTYLSRFHPCVCVSSLSRYSDVFKQSQHTHFVVLGYLGNLNRCECGCKWLFVSLCCSRLAVCPGWTLPVALLGACSSSTTLNWISVDGHMDRFVMYL